MDTVWCQGAQNTGLSSHKLKSALKCTIWDFYRHTDKQMDIMAIARRFVLRNASRAKNYQLTTVITLIQSEHIWMRVFRLKFTDTSPAPLNTIRRYAVVYIIIRPRRSCSAAAYSCQTFPWTICLSVRTYVCTCIHQSTQCIVEKRQIGSGCRLAS